MTTPFVFLVAFGVVSAAAWSVDVLTTGAACSGGGCGSPLLLTPFLEKGQLAEARNLSAVDAAALGLPASAAARASPMHAGFLAVQGTSAKNQMYFNYWPAMSGDPNAPLILWLQGGPGATSLFGNWVEIGPYGIDATGKAYARNETWNEKFSLLFIDQPVGTGYSYSEGGFDNFVRSQDEIGVQLYDVLLQFFKLFPQHLTNDFYVAGESYAGKYVPTIAHRIHVENARVAATGNAFLPLAGISIGDPMSDPALQMMIWTTNLYQGGLLDSRQAQVVSGVLGAAKEAHDKGDYTGAFPLMNSLWCDCPCPAGGSPSLFQNMTGLQFPLDTRVTEAPAALGYFGPFIDTPAARRATHVGDRPFGGNGTNVYKILGYESGEVMRDSALPFLPTLLQNYKFLIYNGVDDALLPPITGEALITAAAANATWTGGPAFLAAPRYIWKVAKTDADVAGYVRVLRGSEDGYNGGADGAYFAMVAVRGSGHLAPFNQPRRCKAMIESFVSGGDFGTTD